MALPRQLVNGSFEEPKLPPGGQDFFPDASTPKGVPGWKTEPPGDKIELWSSGHEKVPAVQGEGAQFAELNTDHATTLFQDLETRPGTTMFWRLLHRGRLGVDTMAVVIGAPGEQGVRREIADGNERWGEHRGTYTVPAGQTTTRFAFESVAAADPTKPSIGNFLDGIAFGAFPDELPPIFPREDVTVPPASQLSGSYIIYHHVSGGYLFPDNYAPVVGGLVQTWHMDPVDYKDGASAGWRWVLEPAGDGAGDGYLIRAHEPIGTPPKQLYLEAIEASDTTQKPYPTMQLRKAGNDRQIWYFARVAGDPTTFAIVSKEFNQFALGIIYGYHVDVSSHCILSRTWGQPLLQHYWRLQAVTEDAWLPKERTAAP